VKARANSRSSALRPSSSRTIAYRCRKFRAALFLKNGGIGDGDLRLGYDKSSADLYAHGHLEETRWGGYDKICGERMPLTAIVSD
jgi:hypothetical protein